MPFRPALLSNFPILHSSDPEFVRESLFTLYGASSFDIATGEDTFAAQVNHLQIGDLRLSYSDYASEVSVGFGEASFVRQIFNVEGAGQYSAGSCSGTIAPGSSTPVLPAQTPLKIDFKPRSRQLVLRIEFDTLLRNLTALLGQTVDHPLTFDGTAVRDP